MNVLVITAVLPFPLLSGGQIRLYHLLKRLSQHHEITLLSYIREDTEREQLSNLDFCQQVIPIMRGKAWQARYLVRSITSDVPFLYATYDNAELKQVASQLIANQHFDGIHLEPGYVWLGKPDSEIPIVVAEHNIEHTIYEGFTKVSSLPFAQSALGFDVRKMRCWEEKIWKTATEIIAVSEADKQEILPFTHQPVTVVPNGIDETWFVSTERKVLKADFRALFLGDFRWMQNKQALQLLTQKIWPEISAVYPQAKLEIVGRDIPQLATNSSIIASEQVPDIRQAFNRADVLLAPITIGGGTKYKILEAMASGLPVLTTEKGIQGLQVTIGKHVSIAETPHQWVEVVTDWIKQPRLYQQLSREGRRLVEANYSWQQITSLQDQVWRRAFHGR